jgi:hypothetical protein
MIYVDLYSSCKESLEQKMSFTKIGKQPKVYKGKAIELASWLYALLPHMHGMHTLVYTKIQVKIFFTVFLLTCYPNNNAKGGK